MKKGCFIIPVLFALILFQSSCKKEGYKSEGPSKEETVSITYNNLKQKFQDASVKARNLVKGKGLESYFEGNTTNLNENPQIPLTEEEAEEIVDPLIAPSAAYILSNFDVNVYDYMQPNDPEIVTLGAFAIKMHEIELQGYTVDTTFMDTWNPSFAFGNGINGIAAPDPSIFDCAMDALGIPAGMILATAENTSRKAIIKAAKKLASRTLGFVGLFLAVYEFGDCMEWW